MPKLKTNKAMAKRFRITRRGKVLHKQAGRGHLLVRRRPKRMRHLRKVGQLAKVMVEQVKKLIPYPQ